MRYPLLSPASTFACPRHGLAVALDDDGRIVSECPSCVRVAEAAEELLAAQAAERRADTEQWRKSA